jgi:hypothetical protein
MHAAERVYAISQDKLIIPDMSDMERQYCITIVA